MRVALIIVAMGLLAACAGQRAEDAYSEADAACRARYASDTNGYSMCMQFKAAEFQASEDRRARIGAGLQNLGNSLQNMGQAPAYQAPRQNTTQCHQVGIYWQCNSF